ncbi:hypothetical protein M3J51_29245, partial [Klebsiella pneumoniae]|nr:hypothetical protein [Klebsiella pneumoniae]
CLQRLPFQELVPHNCQGFNKQIIHASDDLCTRNIYTTLKILKVGNGDGSKSATPQTPLQFFCRLPLKLFYNKNNQIYNGVGNDSATPPIPL